MPQMASVKHLPLRNKAMSCDVDGCCPLRSSVGSEEPSWGVGRLQRTASRTTHLCVPQPHLDGNLEEGGVQELVHGLTWTHRAWGESSRRFLLYSSAYLVHCTFSCGQMRGIWEGLGSSLGQEIGCPDMFRVFFFLFGLWDYRHCGHSWPILPASGDNEDDCGEHDGM
jgi:hypothetical protein